MKAIKVNADYEAVLFNLKKSLPIINESLEFLAFFISDKKIISHKKYTSDYLDHVESLIGRMPQVMSEGIAENWWGALKNIPLEQKLNSKEMSAELNISEGWCTDTHIISDMTELPILDKTYLAKNPYGMSGQNFSLVEYGRLENLESMLKRGKVILEPFLERVYDFSHYIYPNGIKICYQNIVDQKFQYRGTLFQDYTNPDIKLLSFHSAVEKSEWDEWKEALEKIITHYRTPELECGFSIDSFIYREKNKLKIRYLSEVNYRRTMGQVAFELSMKFGGLRKWSLFVLAKNSGLTFSAMKEKLAPLKWSEELSSGVVLLSPGDVRYDMFFLSAVNAIEGKELFNDLKKLLPDSEFSIEL